jgi:predicted transcriptional regulator
MVTREQLAKLLQAVNVEEVAKEAKVSTKTVYRLRHMETPPRYSTVERLLAAIKRLERCAKVSA